MVGFTAKVAACAAVSLFDQNNFVFANRAFWVQNQEFTEFLNQSFWYFYQIVALRHSMCSPRPEAWPGRNDPVPNLKIIDHKTIFLKSFNNYLWFHHQFWWLQKHLRFLGRRVPCCFERFAIPDRFMIVAESGKWVTTSTRSSHIESVSEKSTTEAHSISRNNGFCGRGDTAA